MTMNMLMRRVRFTLVAVMAVALIGCPRDREPKNAKPHKCKCDHEPDASSAEWEQVAAPTGYRIFRTKAPGGWLLTKGATSTVTFYPDPQHQWLTPKTGQTPVETTHLKVNSVKQDSSVDGSSE